MSHDTNTTTIDLSRTVRRVVFWCILFEALLITLDIVFNLVEVVGDESIQKIFNSARETSLPTWFASGQAAAVGFTAILCWWAARSGAAKGMARWGWLVVSSFFLYISADDASEIHERVGSTLRRATNLDSVSFSWHVFIAPILAVWLLISLAIIFRIGTKAARRYVLLGAFFFFVSQGMDFVEGIDGLFDLLAEQLKVSDYTVSHIAKVIEETLEMLGTTMWWAAVLDSAVALLSGRQFSLTSEPELKT